MKTRTLSTAIVLATALIAEAQVVMNIDAQRRGPQTSPYQYGLFFEEINHAGDGGLYAELVKNRSFENGLDGWERANAGTLTLLTKDLLNSAQKQALSITTATATEERMRGAKNTGYWGMKFEKDSIYSLSLWAKGDNDGYTGKVVAQLLKKDGRTVIGEARLEGTIATDKWSKLTATIKATDTDYSGQLQLLTSNNGRLDIDVVSLFPYTWKGRKNGLRPDLAQLLADTKPAFLRFPGGCYVEGEGSWSQTFQWKKTIGPIEQRPGHMNQNWHYWSSDGLGFDEYLQLAEDMEAAPMFVVNVGLGHGYYIPMEDLDTLVQNTLDAIEYANGDASTKFGAMRIANGHAEPYNLKFIEIGNENYNFNMSGNSDQSYQYPERYYKFYKAIKEKYPEIITIGNVEAWGTDNPTWRNEYPVELVDEHYYRTFAWMRDNYNKYDNYSRNIGVYVGEYAANSGSWGKYGNLNAALGEAIFMLGMEKNSDVVRMGSFAPIFMHEEDPTWNYDMIHFNSGSNFVTPSYHVQKMFGNNLGGQNLLWTETGNRVDATGKYQVGVATWNTQASYDDVKVTTTTGVVLSDDFSQDNGWMTNGGSWSVTDGVKRQTAGGDNNGLGCRSINLTQFTGDYTLELRARKDGGAEGFLIIFDYQDENNYSWWNIGGWNNSQHAVEVCRNGSKSTVASAGGWVNNGQWYDLKIEVKEGTVSCYMDGNLIHQYTQAYERSLYQSVQLSADGTELILKVVNPNSTAQQLVLNVANMTVGSGTVQRLTSANGTDENTMDEPTVVAPGELEAVADASKLDIPAYSLNIYRFSVSNVGAEIPQPTVKDYPEYVEEDENMAAYLYAHMYETGEHTCYALSQTGQEWNDLFNSAEVFNTAENTVTGGMRDSYICRMNSKKGFLLAGTDMTSSLGWTSNHIMVLMSSPDLVHWTKNVKIDLETEENLEALSVVYPNMDADKMTAAWAPEIIYDRETGNYVLYYSVGFPDRHRIFYQLIDEDLNILTEPRLYFDPGYDIIDADIVWNAVDQQYVMLFKCESTNGFDRATATKLVPEEGATGTTVWSVTPDFHVGENNQAIEGMSMWRPIGDLRWRLAYINYSGGYTYRIRYMDEHCMNVDPAGYTISGNLRPQHGSFVKLTQLEYDYLLTWEKVVNLLSAVKAYNSVIKTEQHETAIKVAEDALNTARATVEENAKAMADALELLQACPTEILPEAAIEAAVKNGSGDLTILIKNADFSAGASGWTPQPGFTAANGQVAEYWNTNFRFSQTIEGLPNGKYELSVQSFYRNGNIDPALASHKNGTEKLNAILFANKAELPVMSLYDDRVTNYTENPYAYPDNVSAANQAFNSYGLYTNTLAFELSDGSLEFGIYKTNAVGGDWCCFDNFKLMYCGSGTGITEVNATDEDDKHCYNLLGVHVDKPSKGIYIKNGKKVINH